MAVFYETFSHALPFGVLQPAAAVVPLHVKNTYAKKRGIAKKMIQAVRALMISQDTDLVGGDFNGAAWRCCSRDNLSSIDEAFC